MAESLKNKTIKGSVWSGIDNIIFVGVSFLVSIVLARLLSPDDYGLISIIGIFTAVSTTLINGGFNSALIRKKDVNENDYNTAFICNLGVSILIYSVISFCAPWIADFFHREELTALTRISSVGIIVGALTMVQQTRLTKRIDFKSQTKITIAASASSGIIGIFFAYIGFGVWALVVQQLTAQIIRSVLLLIVNKWIPMLRFSIRSFHELFGFGWKIMVSRLLDTVWKEFILVVVGKYYSPTTLGQFTRANQFSVLFSSNLTSVIERVTYPVLSSIQDDKERMVSAYRRIIKITMFVTANSMFFLGAISDPLLYCLIGAKWLEAATYLPLICLSGSVYPLHAINLNMLQVQGRSDLFLGLEIIKKIIAIGPLCVGAFVGIMPMLWTNIITCVIFFFLNSYYPGKLLGYSSWMQLKDIAPTYGIATFIALSVYFLKFLSISYWLILPLQIIVGGIAFFTLCHITRCEEFLELKNIIKSYMKKYMNEHVY